MVGSRTLLFFLSPVIGVLTDSFESGNGWRAAQGAILVSVYALTRSKMSTIQRKCPKLVHPIPPPTAASHYSTSSIRIPRLQSPESFTGAIPVRYFSLPADRKISGCSRVRKDVSTYPTTGCAINNINIVRANSEQPHRPHSKPRGSRLSSNEKCQAHRILPFREKSDLPFIASDTSNKVVSNAYVMAPSAVNTFALKPPKGESLDASDGGSSIMLSTWLSSPARVSN